MAPSRGPGPARRQGSEFVQRPGVRKAVGPVAGIDGGRPAAAHWSHTSAYSRTSPAKNAATLAPPSPEPWERDTSGMRSEEAM